jgi:ATP-binding cassette, subfamily C, bacterial
MRQRGTVPAWRLFALIGRLLPLIFVTMIAGSLGYLSAMGVTVFGVLAIAKLLGGSVSLSYQTLLTLVIVSGTVRGALRYLEHYTGHELAFRLLARLRSVVFRKLRDLAPSHTDRRNKGDIVSLVTADIETLEVFYAHTIAPVAIAFMVSSVVFVVIMTVAGTGLAIVAASFHVLIGIVMPVRFSAQVKDHATSYRASISRYNSVYLDTLWGMDDAIMTQSVNSRKDMFLRQSDTMEDDFVILKRKLSFQRSVMDGTLGIAVITVTILAGLSYVGSASDMAFLKPVGLTGMLVSVFVFFSGFGPLVALASLPSSLNQTMSSAQRLIEVLDEKPTVSDVVGGSVTGYEGLIGTHVTYAYGDRKVLDDLNIELGKRGIIGIYGASGSGKSTLLRILMRHADPDRGTIRIGEHDLRTLDTAALNDMVGYVMQDTYVFMDTLRANTDLSGKADPDLVREALARTGLDEVALSMPEGMETIVGRGGRALSMGERQRLGLSRVLAGAAGLILLDEPTAHVDIINESLILDTLKAVSKERMIVMVSHKPSTLSVCDSVFEMKDGRLEKRR